MANFTPNSLKTYNGKFDAAKFNKVVDILFRQRLRPSPNCMVTEGSGGTTIIPIAASNGGVAIWPFKAYNTSKGATGHVQINGSDNLVGTINSAIACVNGAPINVKTGSPLAYPQLAISGNGTIYIQVALNSDGSTNYSGGAGGTGCDVLFTAGSISAVDPSTPPTYATQIVATVTNYAVDGVTGNVTFTLANTTVFGFSAFQLCGDSGLWW